MSSRLSIRSLSILALSLTAFYMPSAWAAHGGGGHAGGHATGGGERSGVHNGRGTSGDSERSPGARYGNVAGSEGSYADRYHGEPSNVFTKSHAGEPTATNGAGQATFFGTPGNPLFLFNRAVTGVGVPAGFGETLTGYSPWFNGGGGVGAPAGSYMFNYNPENAATNFLYSYPPAVFHENTGYVTAAVLSPEPVSPQQALPAAQINKPGEPVSTANEPQDVDAKRYYTAAKVFFFRGDYRNSLRLASHAEVEEPGNLKIHELITLSLFAQGNYRAAASEAHATLVMGPLADSTELYDFYPSEETYKAQLDALKKETANNANSAADHFLLGYQYLVLGARDNAQAEFAQATKLTPDDHLASHYLNELKTNAELTPPRISAARKDSAY